MSFKSPLNAPDATAGKTKLSAWAARLSLLFLALSVLSAKAAETVVANYSAHSLTVVNLTTGDRRLLTNSTGTNLFRAPVGVAREADGKLLIGENAGSPRIIRVDPVSGSQTIVSGPTNGTGTNLISIFGIAVEPDGDIIAASPSQRIYRVNPVTGDRVLLASGTVGSGATMTGSFGIMLEDNGDVIFTGYASAPEILRLNPGTGVRTIVSSSNPATSRGTGPALNGPSAVVKLPDGDYAVLNYHPSFTNYVVRIDPTTGNRSLISGTMRGSGPTIGSRYSMALGSDGNLYVADFSANQIVRVEVSTGDRVVVSSSTVGTGPNFSSPLGMLGGTVASIFNPEGITDLAGNELSASFTSGESYIFNPNSAPTDITLSNSSVLQSDGANALVGTLSATDADSGDTHTFALVAGSGDEDNAKFAISGAELRAVNLAALSAGHYSIRVKASDGAGATYEDVLQITVVDDVAPVITGPASVPGVFNSPLSFSIAASGGAVSFGGVGLPAWLGVDSSSGEVAGVPASAGTFQFKVTASDMAGNTATNEVSVHVSQAAAAISLAGLAQVYDGASKVVLATTSPANIPVAVTYGGSATAPTSAGGYTVVATIADSNYSGSVTGILEVAKAPLTASADDKSKIYGSANPALTISYSGFVNGDDAADLDAAPVASTAATATSPVGAYEIALSGGSDANYSITLQSGTLTVGKATLLAKAEDKSKIYGSSNPALTISYSGFVNGDDGADLDAAPVASTAATAESPAGTYEIALSGGSDANYSITLQSGTMTVGKAALSAKADDKSKIYGSGNPTLTISYSGFVNGDDPADLDAAPVASTAATATSPVGAYEIALSGGSDANYSITLQSGTLTVGKATLLAKAEDKSKIYGSANPALTISYSGFVNGDDGADLDASPVASTAATAASPAGTYEIALNGGSDANYSITLQSGTLTVGKAALLAKAEDKSKIYGSANPTLTISYSGFVNGDDAADLDAAPGASTAATATSPVGAYEIALSGGSDANYSITLLSGTLTVGKAALLAKADDKSKIYGSGNPTLTISYSGFVNGDYGADLDAAPVASTAATAASPAGTYEIALDGGSDANYSITLQSGTLTVGKAALLAKADDKSKIYGSANPTLTISYSGFLNGDDAADLDAAPVASTAATAASPAGTYEIALSGGSDANYSITLLSGTLTVGKATLLAKADDKSKIYGSGNPTLTISYSGFVNGDDAADLDAAPMASTTATASSPTGTYEIALSGGTDANYNITLQSGTLTVNKATLLAKADDKSKIYGSGNPTLTISYSGFVNGDDAADLDAAPMASTTATASSPTGTYEIALSGGSDANYSITLQSGTLTVGKATLLAKADDKSKIYGSSNPALTISYSGFVNGDDGADLDAAPVASTAATAASPAGTYEIALSGGSDANYSITLQSGTLTVGKATLLAKAEDKSKIYGSSNPALTISYSGFVNGDDGADLDAAPAASTAATAASPVGTYEIALSGGSDANYSITLQSGTLTVGKAALLAKADDKSKIYGSANPTLTISYSGFVNGDDAADLDAAPMASTTATASSPTGTYEIALSGGTDANYNITLQSGILTVNKATLLAKADDKSKIYGTSNPALTVSYSGFVKGNDAADLDAAPVASTTATAASPAGTYEIALSGGSDANYSITLQSGTLTVGKAALLAKADDKSKIYGSANPTLTISYSGFLNGDDAADLDAAPVASTIATGASPAGQYSITLSAGTDNNYEISVVSGTLTISRATLLVSVDSHTRIYGASNPELTVKYSGFANGDTERSLDFPPVVFTRADVNSPVGVYAIIANSGQDDSYEFAYQEGTLSITKARLVIRAENQSRTYGRENPILTLAYAGLVADDTAADIVDPPVARTTANEGSATGVYPITLTGGSSKNYNIELEHGTLAITKAILTARADNKTRPYGSPNPGLTVTYEGLRNGENAAVLDTPPSLSTAANLRTSAGDYPIVVAGGVDNNYEIVPVNGTLSVAKAVVTAKVGSHTRIYGQPNPSFEMAYSGWKNGESALQLDQPVTVATSATASSPSGIYPITLAGGGDDNYSVVFEPGELHVLKAVLVAQAEDATRSQGSPNPPFAIRYGGFVNGDTAASLVQPPVASTAAESSSAVGAYPIVLAGGSDERYSFDLRPGTLTITHAGLKFELASGAFAFPACDTEAAFVPAVNLDLGGRTNIGRAVLTAAIVTNWAPGDLLALRKSLITADLSHGEGSLLAWQGADFGLLSGGADGSPLQVRFFANAQAHHLALVLSNLVFKPSAQIPGQRAIEIRIVTADRAEVAGMIHVAVVGCPEIASRELVVLQDSWRETPVEWLASSTRQAVGEQRVELSEITEKSGSAILTNGVMRYSPPAGFVGHDSINYKIVTDGSVVRGRVNVHVLASGQLVAIDLRRSNSASPERIQLGAAGRPGQRVRILVSPDLLSWRVLGEAIVTPEGVIEFRDAGASLEQFRFYRTEEL